MAQEVSEAVSRFRWTRHERLLFANLGLCGGMLLFSFVNRNEVVYALVNDVGVGDAVLKAYNAALVGLLCLLALQALRLRSRSRWYYALAMGAAGGALFLIGAMILVPRGALLS